MTEAADNCVWMQIKSAIALGVHEDISQKMHKASVVSGVILCRKMEKITREKWEATPGICQETGAGTLRGEAASIRVRGPALPPPK